MTIEMLTPERAEELWPVLEPLYMSACESHEIAKDEMDAGTIRDLARNGLCAVFVGYIGPQPACTIALQFHYTNGRKGADLIAMAGQNLLTFKSAYWNIIMDWLKANGCEFLDAYVPESRIGMYKKKFGFDKSCALVRKTLH